MTNLDRSSVWRPAMVLLAISIASGGMGRTAAAQSDKETSKPPPTANKESEKDTSAPGAIGVSEGEVSSTVAPAAGLRVVKDLETGKLRGPDRAEAARMATPGAGTTAVPPRVIELPKGNKLVLLDGQFMSETVARRTPQGGITLECHPGASAGHSHSLAEPNPTTRSAGAVGRGASTAVGDQGDQPDAK